MNDSKKEEIEKENKKVNSFIEYTKKREAMGLNVINVTKKEEQIEYLQKRYTKTKEQINRNQNNITNINNSNVKKEYLTRTNNNENIVEEIYNISSNSNGISNNKNATNINVEYINEKNNYNTNNRYNKEYNNAKDRLKTKEQLYGFEKNHYIKKYYGEDYLKENSKNEQKDQKEKKEQKEQKEQISNMIKNIEKNIYSDKYSKTKTKTETKSEENELPKEDKKSSPLTNGIIVKCGYIATEEYRKHRDTQTIVLKRNMDNRIETIREDILEDKYNNIDDIGNDRYKRNNKIEEIYNMKILKPYKKYGQIIKKNIQNKENKEENTMEEKEIFLTKEGYENLEKELARLKSTERDNIAERIKVAKAHGDLSENGEYDEAKRAQENNENQIGRLEYMLEVAQIIDRDEIDLERVQVGNTVYITNIANKKEQKYTIVGTAEANILQGKISNESPIAKSLLDAKVGDIVQVEAPIGIIEYKVKKITLE